MRGVKEFDGGRGRGIQAEGVQGFRRKSEGKQAEGVKATDDRLKYSELRPSA
jgi:hypothetical protein